MFSVMEGYPCTINTKVCPYVSWCKHKTEIQTALTVFTGVGVKWSEVRVLFKFVSCCVQPVFHLSVFHGIFTGFVSIYVYIVCMSIYTLSLSL
jgi:hypothetical protein